MCSLRSFKHVQCDRCIVSRSNFRPSLLQHLRLKLSMKQNDGQCVLYMCPRKGFMYVPGDGHISSQFTTPAIVSTPSYCDNMHDTWNVYVQILGVYLNPVLGSTIPHTHHILPPHNSTTFTHYSCNLNIFLVIHLRSTRSLLSHLCPMQRKDSQSLHRMLPS